MGVERGAGVALAPLDFEIFSKKGCLLCFEWEKRNFTTFAPPGKILEKFPRGPTWKKSFRRPCLYLDS